jgi:Uma2 family endonuclease
MAATTILMTAEQLLARAGNGRAELEYGELVELMPVGELHSLLVARLLVWLAAFSEKSRLGRVGTELGFVLEKNPDLVRGPDVYFLSKARALHPPSTKFREGAPDLAIEVLSPDDRASKVQEKIREYLSAGAKQVWIVDPETATVTVHLPGGASQSYAGDSEVSGGDILPGFSFRPANLFHFDDEL